MENLKTIARIIEKINLKTSDFLVINRPKKLNTDIFYEKIVSGSFKTDLDAAQFFFKTTPSHSSYKNLKSSLKEKLINTLSFIDPSIARTDMQGAYLYCAKYFFIAKILIPLGASKMSMELSQKVFNKAKKFELTEYIVYTSKMLRLAYGTAHLDKDKFLFYNEQFKKYKRILDAEGLAEEYYGLLLLPYSSGNVKHEETAQQAQQFYQDLAPSLKTSESPFLHLTANLIKLTGELSANDYQSTILTCEKALHFFEQKPYKYKAPLQMFLHSQLICYIQLKDFEKGKLVGNKAVNSVNTGSYSWFVNKELLLMLALHSKAYKEAYVMLSEAIGNYKFNTLRPDFKERFLIYKAYINFLISIDKIATTEETKKFRLAKFLNSVPTYAKDKRGLNIPILIIQILFAIVKKDYDQSIDRFEAIKKYCSRYLRGNENLRSNCFINMLLQIPLANFHKAAVERKAKKYYDKLLATPLDIANQAQEIEIIPYEDLWEIALVSLEMKIYRW